MSSTDLRHILASLSAEQWYGIITADPSGLLPACCAEISDLRDELTSLLRFPVDTTAARVAGMLTNGTHEYPPALTVLAASLVEHLEAKHGDRWSRLAVDDPAADALFDAYVTFTGGFGGPDRPAPVAGDWQPLFAAMLTLVDGLDSVERLGAFRAAGAAALAAGAPPAALNALHTCAVELFRAARASSRRDAHPEAG